MLPNKNPNQKNLDVLSVVFFISVAVAYVLVLKNYVSQVPGNVILLLFLVSPALAIIKDLRTYPYRIALSKMNATGVYYLISVLFAAYLRGGYTAYAKTLSEKPDVIADLGAAYAAMLSNPAFGVGGAFALSLMIVRLCIFNKLQAYANKAFTNPEHRLRACPTCGQECAPTR